MGAATQMTDTTRTRQRIESCHRKNSAWSDRERHQGTISSGAGVPALDAIVVELFKAEPVQLDGLTDRIVNTQPFHRRQESNAP